MVSEFLGGLLVELLDILLDWRDARERHKRIRVPARCPATDANRRRRVMATTDTCVEHEVVDCPLCSETRR